ncbi:MAG: sialidase family protein [Acidobacteriota bacterium]
MVWRMLSGFSWLRGLVALGALKAMAVVVWGAEAPTIEVTQRFSGPSPQIAAQQPSLAAAGDSLYLAYGAGNAIYCAVSTDGGRSFSASRLVSDKGVLALGRHRGPRIAVSGKSVVVSAIVGAQGKGRDGDLWAWRSADGGKTWSAGVVINDVPAAAREGLHGMAAGPNGLFFVVWLDLRDLGTGTRLFGAASTDGGKTWGPDTLVYQSPDGTICQCCHPSVAIRKTGEIQIMWRNALKGARDLYTLSSPGPGRPFGRAVKLGVGSWQLDSCPMDGGDLTLSGSNGIESVWRRQDEVFLTIGTSPEKRLGKGKDPAIVCVSTGCYVAWQDVEGRQVMFTGPGAEEPSLLASRGGYVDMAANARGRVVAAWEEEEEGTRRIALAILP